MHSLLSFSHIGEMSWRPRERGRLRLEMGSDQLGTDDKRVTGFAESHLKHSFSQQSVTVGRHHKNNSAPIPFISGGKVCSDSTETEEEKPEENATEIKKELPEWSLKMEPKGSSNSTNATPLGDIDWVNSSHKGHVLLQMMNAMGYEHGKGLGKTAQGIVEPIKPNPNLGKKAFGAQDIKDCKERRRGKRGEGRKRLKQRTEEEQQTDDGKDGATEEGQREDRQRAWARPNPSRRAQMHYEDNVRETLKAAGFSEKSTEDIWQALSTLATHQIMPLGMGLGLVKRRAGRTRFNGAQRNDHQQK